MRSYPAILIRPLSSSPEFADLIAAALDDFGVVALDHPDGRSEVRAFFQEEASRDQAIRALRTAFPDVELETLDVPDENWAERSQASLRAVTVGGLTVAPPWDVSPERAETTIVILPSMGFGTGHHATTRLCMTALQRADVSKASVLDVGTGSGVLALAAARLGATRVMGIDNDPDAITNAMENRALNQIDVEFRIAGVEDTVIDDADFDLLLANLTGGALIRHAKRIEDLIRKGGRMILSGLREEEERDVLGAFEATLTSRTVEDGWICLVLRR